MRAPHALLMFGIGCDRSASPAQPPLPPDTPPETGAIESDTASPLPTNTDAPRNLCAALTNVAIVDGAIVLDDLQLALDAAMATVTVCPGTYAGTFESLKALHVVGEGGAAVTVLDGRGQGRTLDVVSGTTVEGLTITGGSATQGGGLRLTTEEGVYVVRDCVITGNAALWTGGGVFVAEGSVASFPGTSITRNSSGNAGGGMYAWTGTTVDLTGATIKDNKTTDEGGGVYFDGELLVGGTISRNVAEQGGGLCTGVDYRMEGTVIESNNAEYGGGMFVFGRYPYYDHAIDEWVYPARTVTLVDVQVRHNVSTTLADLLFTGGGGISGYAMDLVLEGATVIEGNKAASLGGGVYVSSGSITGGAIQGNTAASGGGLALMLSEASAVTVADNLADRGGGVVMIHGATLRDVLVERNTAVADGGGVWVDPEASYFGRGYYALPGPALIHDSMIRDNVAMERGGGAVLDAGAWMEVFDSDWGDVPDDNAPDDVALPSVGYVGYTAAESFTCDDVACDPAP